jgi:hypothetical protein
LPVVHRRVAPARAAPPWLEYGTETSRKLAVAFGAFVAVVALIPTCIVLVQALTWREGDASLPTAPEGAVFGALLALWGVLVATRHERVTVDAKSRKLTWTKFAFGRAYRKVTWAFDDVTAIEIVESNSVKPQGCSAVASGPRGTRELVAYFHSRHAPPSALRETARALGIQITTR